MGQQLIFQHFYGIEIRQHKSWIQAREQARQQNKGNQQKQSGRGKQRSERQFFIRKIIEKREGQLRQQQGKSRRNQRKKKRFAQKLLDKLRTLRPHRLAHAHLPRPQRGAGRWEIEVVETRQQQDAHGHRHKNAHELDGVSRPYAVVHAVAEVNIAQRDHVQRPGGGVRVFGLLG